MTKPEILKYINTKISYTKTNDLFIWSDWHTFQPENLKIMKELRDENRKEFEIEIVDNKFRLRRQIFKPKSINT